MRREWTSLTPRERVDASILTVFLSGRLSSVEAVDWALAVDRADRVKRSAILDLVDSSEGRKLGEPWRSAWRLIEEAWDSLGGALRADPRPYDLGARVRGGDRSGSLVSAIADFAAPRLTISSRSRQPPSDGARRRNPRTVAELVSARLASADVIDPRVMALDKVDDEAFLAALLNALESALVHGLDIARRFGWDGKTRLYRVGQLFRVNYVSEGGRRPNEHEPDEFHEGIAPCVKLMHFVAERLIQRRAQSVRNIIARWKSTPSPIHLRLWAALAQDPWVADADDVGRTLLSLDHLQFWDVQQFPECAELRARRFAELSADAQNGLMKRLRKMQPRKSLPRGFAPQDIARGRRNRLARELRRIEVAGGNFPAPDKAWIAGLFADFPHLAAMNRLDDGFLGTAQAVQVPIQPDTGYDNLAGDARLSALETAFNSSQQGGWDDEAASRAWDWLRMPGNASTLIADFEASSEAGGRYPKVWERFGSIPLSVADRQSDADGKIEANRVLVLLETLPITTATEAIQGLSNWLSNWRVLAVRSPHGLGVWRKLWPLAVAATNAMQPPDAQIDLNVVGTAVGDHEPMDLDTLNTPTGNLIGVFLAACPNLEESNNPFAVDGFPRTMREIAISERGRSGIIVRHRLIEHLQYFLRADAGWTHQHLIAALLDDSADAVSLWRALARQTQFVEVLKLVGDAVVSRASDSRLGRETRRSLVFSVVIECLHALFQGREPAVAYASAQQMLRGVDDELRSHAASGLHQFVREMASRRDGEKIGPPAEDLFDGAVSPFLNNVWPQERSLSTPGVSEALADLPATTEGAFARAVDAIERFLVPFRAWSLLDYGLSDVEDNAWKLANIDTFELASALLRLLDATIGKEASAVVPYDLATALGRIEEIAPPLARDRRFRRLAAAARR